MKTKHLTLLILLALIAPPGFAGQAYKCVAADGSVSFGFVPCPEPVSELTVAQNDMAELTPKQKIQEIDGDIADVKAQLDTVKYQYELALQSNDGRSDELTAEFDESTTNLLNKLITLQKKRRQAISSRI